MMFVACDQRLPLLRESVHPVRLEINIEIRGFAFGIHPWYSIDEEIH